MPPAGSLLGQAPVRFCDVSFRMHLYAHAAVLNKE